jgi:aconitase B
MKCKGTRERQERQLRFTDVRHKSFNPPAGEEEFLTDLLSNRVPAGVDQAAYVKAGLLTAKRLLNHKSNDITAQYIQWHSRENLMVMKKALESVVY